MEEPFRLLIQKGKELAVYLSDLINRAPRRTNNKIKNFKAFRSASSNKPL
ncbi:hypothetical protein HanXRQr2_Chr09g0361961 [Helianthus annuus]|uniref:Uncharacterized protein n=1 Tax=Helianthus annuus TaxID=4232 RepID=A0A9K3I262_HELAN|nr:hypothetical protein HanXRQr2_Chr09g0361961 [Helianthus annuus]KAJ0891067.1 hypothetical protein HanPSC8_Chr09g0349261 [Helianthus annuus]